MTAVLLVASIAGFSACAGVHEPTALETLKADQRMAVIRDCHRRPARYGFPYTAEEYQRWRADVGAWMPNLSIYCVRVGKVLVR